MTEIELYMSGGLNGKYIAIDGTETWYQNGQKHRLDGPARIWTDGTQAWWQNDQKHRLDGPAYIGADGTQAWWQNGERHRLDGPAVIRPDGTQEWFIHSIDITETVKGWMQECSVTWPFSKEAQIEFLLRFYDCYA